MTDEQWLWLFVNQAIDNDEQIEGMCPSCQREVTSHNCTRCGKSLGSNDSKGFEPQFVNPNFDTERFEVLSHGTTDDENDPDHDSDDIDYDLVDRIIKEEK